MYFIVVMLLILLSGLFSGLTLGLFSLNLTTLMRKAKLGDPRAARLLPVRKNGNLLLCSLLLGNVAVNSTIAILLGSISSGIIAGIVSTVLIVLFGEILPQAFFARNAMSFGAQTIWLVKIIIFLFYPVAAPIAWVLNKILGKEMPTIWSKKELQEIIKFHEDHQDAIIDRDEERIILGALSFSEKTAQSIITPSTVVFSLEENEKMNQTTLKKIRDHGFTRIPVYQATPENITGVLYTKDLLGNTNNVTAGKLAKKDAVLMIEPVMTLDTLLNLFIKKRRHLAFVYNSYGIFLGVVSMEDVIEEILKREIVDETDGNIDMRSLAKKKFTKFKNR